MWPSLTTVSARNSSCQLRAEGNEGAAYRLVQLTGEKLKMRCDFEALILEDFSILAIENIIKKQRSSQLPMIRGTSAQLRASVLERQPKAHLHRFILAAYFSFCVCLLC